MEVDEVGEARPRHHVVFFLQLVVPVGGNTIQMQGCHLDLFARWCPGPPEEGLAFVEPRKGIRQTIIVVKLELGPVCRVAVLFAVVAVGAKMPAMTAAIAASA